MKIVLKSANAVTQASIQSQPGEENFARLTVERNSEIEEQISRALGKHGIAQQGYLNVREGEISPTTFVTNLSEERLVETLQAELTVCIE